jgi:hypothetical protein
MVASSFPSQTQPLKRAKKSIVGDSHADIALCSGVCVFNVIM